MRTFSTTVYNYQELTEEAKRFAIDNYKEKCADNIYEDLSWSLQNDDIWFEKLSDTGLTYGGYDHLYFDDYRGNSGFGDLDIEDTAKLAGQLGLDKRSKAYKLIASGDVRFTLNTSRDYNSIRDVEFEEYGITGEEFEELPAAVTDALQLAADRLKDLIQDLEADILKSYNAQEEYSFSDEAIIDNFEANEYEFNQDGGMA